MIGKALGAPKVLTPPFCWMVWALKISGRGGVRLCVSVHGSGRLPIWVKIELEELKQKIRHLPVDNFNITVTEVLPHNSVEAPGGGR